MKLVSVTCYICHDTISVHSSKYHNLKDGSQIATCRRSLCLGKFSALKRAKTKMKVEKVDLDNTKYVTEDKSIAALQEELAFLRDKK